MKTNEYQPRNYSESELAYLAGIIDGEGSIYIGNFSWNPKTQTPYYQTNMEVTNTDEGLIIFLCEKFGGKYSKYTPNQTPKNSRKTVYRWIATGERLTHLCELILPYLVIKHKQAKIMLKMRETFKGTGAVKGKSGCQPVSKETLEMRKMFFDQMRKLHCRNYNNK